MCSAAYYRLYKQDMFDSFLLLARYVPNVGYVAKST